MAGPSRCGDVPAANASAAVPEAPPHSSSALVSDEATRAAPTACGLQASDSTTLLALQSMQQLFELAMQQHPEAIRVAMQQQADAIQAQTALLRQL